MGEIEQKKAELIRLRNVEAEARLKTIRLLRSVSENVRRTAESVREWPAGIDIAEQRKDIADGREDIALQREDIAEQREHIVRQLNELAELDAVLQDQLHAYGELEAAADAAEHSQANVLAQRGLAFLSLTPQQFEEAVAELLKRDGFRDIRVVGGAGDLGADVTARASDGATVVIQCKRYHPTRLVGSGDVQRFGGTCYAVHQADHAFVVTTTGFTTAAIDYAKHVGIHLVDAAWLRRWAHGESTLLPAEASPSR
ncbi:restriction endonuclease [Streptomyces sp. NPDC005395]|uniref:restriction endonuclease n=1 Tax=Streptomyces sp. NPDC005395 TaxID=3157042 RepID=UPI0033AA2120